MMNRYIGYILLLVPLVAHATIYEVLPGSSIQQQIEAAQDGDTIVLHDGTFTESVILVGRNLTVASLYLLDGDSSHIGRTVIEPDFSRPDTGSCLLVAYQTQATNSIVGLTLHGGAGTRWNRFSGVTTAGGALLVDSARVRLEHCRIRNSFAVVGGGIAIGIDAARSSLVRLQDVSITGCYADQWGGGIYAFRCSLAVINSVLQDNGSGFHGGGVYAGFSHVTLHNSTFRGCVGVSGGLDVGWSSGRVTACIFEGNGSNAGAMSDLNLTLCTVPVRGCVFRNNTTFVNSIWMEGSPQRPIQFIGNLVENNVATVATGTLLLTQNSYGEIAYNVFAGNVTNRGGAIACPGPGAMHVRIHHNVLTANSSLDPTEGSAFVAYGLARASLDSNLIMGNYGVAVSCVANTGASVIHAEHNWWGDASGPYHPALNPAGRGDTLLSDSVLFIPWLTEPPDTTMPSAIERPPRPEFAATWRLAAAYPNPFNSEVRLIIAGFTRGDFRLTLHNLLGQEVDVLHTGALTGGELLYRAPSGLASGVYFVNASGGGFMDTRKVVLIR